MVVAASAGGCTPRGEYDPTIRRERLLAIYPPGQTSREDVRKRWQPIEPEFKATKPADGWSAEFTVIHRSGAWESASPAVVRTYVMASEQRTGKPVESLECYVGPDGWFGLCYCWFYYDEGDQVVDAEWQYHTD